MDNNNVKFSTLSSEEINSIKKFEKEFTEKYNKSIYLLALNNNK